MITNNGIIISKELKAPLTAVWKAWSHADILAQWWCAAPSYTRVDAMEFRAGGAFNLTVLDASGERKVHPGSFLQVIPAQRIVYTSLMTGEWIPVESPSTPATVTIMLTPDDQRTYCQIRILYASEQVCKKHKAEGIKDTWDERLQQLETLASAMNVEFV